MLVKICLKDGVPLVNIVRRQEQVDLLKSIGQGAGARAGLSSLRAPLTARLSRIDPRSN